MHIKPIMRTQLRFFTDPAGGGTGGGATPPTASQTPGASTPTDSAAPAASADEPLGEAGLKALQAEREKAAKATKDLADLKKQMADAQKTEEQRQKEALEEATKAREAAEARALRFEVAAEKGLDLKLAPRLTGATREELEADAAALLALVGPKDSPPTPRPDPSAGKTGDVKPKSMKDAIAAHYGG